MRPAEWLLIAYFSYVAVAAAWFFNPWKAWALAAVVASVVWALSRSQSLARDLAPIGFTLIAYREMNWFTPATYDHHLENVWIGWDRWLLDQWHLRASLESAGALIPFFLELCYLLVYSVGAVSVGSLFWNRRRDAVSRFWLAYLAGTLGAYALFPYFPSEPPRTAFAAADLPNIVTVMRRVNLWIVGGYGIHSSVFPSAHVSSAFSAAWGLMVTLRERRWIGWLMALYAFLVAVATVYGRYHYAVDAVAGLAVSLLAAASLGMATSRSTTPNAALR